MLLTSSVCLPVALVTVVNLLRGRKKSSTALKEFMVRLRKPFIKDVEP